MILLPGCGKEGTGDADASGKSEAMANLDRALADFRAAGGVVDLSELNDLEQIPAGAKNAADYHNFIMDRVNAITDEDRGKLADPWELSDAELNAAFKFYKDLVPQIKEAARIPECDWKLDYEQGMDLRLPHLVYMRSCMFLLRADAILAMRSDDYEAAYDSIESAILLSQHIGAESMLIGVLVNAAIGSDIVRTIGYLFDERKEVQLEDFESLLNSMDIREQLRRSLLTEVTLLVGEERRVRLGSRDAALKNIDERFAAEIEEFVRTTCKYALATEEPYYNLGAVRAPVIPNSWNSKDTDVASAYDRACHAIATIDCEREIAKMALRLRGIYQRTGEYPDPATIETPVDPIDGGRIQYERLPEGGFRLTSSGTRRDGEKIVWEWE